MILVHQLVLDGTIHTPLTLALPGTQVREYQLCALHLVEGTIPGVDLLGTLADLVVGMIAIHRVDESHVQRHLTGQVGSIQHLRILLLLCRMVDTYQLEVAGLGKLHQHTDILLLVGRRLQFQQHGVLLRTDDTHILCGLVVRNLVIEHRKLRHLDKVAEALLQLNRVRKRELILLRLLREDSRPSVETGDALLLQCLRTQIQEQQIQLRETVGDGGTAQERGTEVTARLLLYSPQRHQHVKGSLAPLYVTQSCHTVVTCHEAEVLELVTLVHKDMVDTQLIEVGHVVLLVGDIILQLGELGVQVVLTLLQTALHLTGNLVVVLIQLDSL